jgi:mono/diheme cytochrome c family protein
LPAGENRICSKNQKLCMLPLTSLVSDWPLRWPSWAALSFTDSKKYPGEKMKHNKTTLIVTLSLIAGLILVGCGTQSTPEPIATEAPQSTDSQEAPTEMAEAAPTEAPAEAPAEAPTEVPAEAPAAAVSFANDVAPIIQSRCINCHGGDRTEEGLVMLSYAELLAGSDNGPVIVPGDPANSLLVELVTTQKMPKRGPKLTPPQVEIITSWVAAGAPNN